MVSKELDIYSLYNTPEAISQEGIKTLVYNIERMPWCSAYQIALARGYANEDSYLQKKHLRIAATYSGDREVLFSYLTDQTQVDEGVDSPVENLNTIEVPETSEVDKKEEHPNLESVLDSSFESEKETTENVEEPTTAVDENDEPLEEAEKNSDSSCKVDFDELVTYNPLEELSKYIPEDTKTESSHSVAFDRVVYDPEKELAKIANEKDSEEEHDFLFWLNNPREKNDTNDDSKSKSVDHVQNLLDQFLATKRNRPIKKTEFYSAEAKVEESESDDMDVITETLLELYIKQGHYQKAIKGYRKLSLQNPSKSAYFAARIKEIEHI